MSAFDDAIAKAQPAVDMALGERLQLCPMAAGEFMGAASADPGRAIRVVTGVVIERTSSQKMTDAPVGRDFDSHFITMPKTAFIAEAALMVDGALTLPQQHDRIVRLDHGNEVLDVTAATEHDGAGTRIFRLADVNE